MKRKTLLGVALAACLIGPGTAIASEGAITRAWASPDGYLAYVAGTLTITPEVQLTQDFSGSPGEPQLWVQREDEGRCLQYFGRRLSPPSRLIWRFEESPVEGTYSLPSNALAIDGWSAPCLYLVINRGTSMMCVAGWPYALRDYCPKEAVESFATLDSARLRLSPRVACQLSRREARRAQNRLRQTMRLRQRNRFRPRYKRVTKGEVLRWRVRTRMANWRAGKTCRATD